MKLGIFTALFQDRPLGQVLRMAAELGYETVELPCFRGNPHVDIDAVIEDRGKSLSRLVRSFGLEISALGNARESQMILGPHDWTMDRWAPVQGAEERIRYATERLKRTAQAAAMLGVPVVNGFSGSPVWDKWYNFPSTNEEAYERGWQLFAERFNPILDVFKEYGVRYAYEVHPTEIAYNIETAERALEVLDSRPEFGFNFDPSHLVWQGLDPAKFIYAFSDRIYHVHVKDSKANLDGQSSVLSSHINFGDRRRGWDFVSPGHGDVKFEPIVRALNRIGYQGPLSVEWEDSGMDREHGAAEAVKLVRQWDFPASQVAFDAAFQK